MKPKPKIITAGIATLSIAVVFCYLAAWAAKVHANDWWGAPTELIGVTGSLLSGFGAIFLIVFGFTDI